MASSEDLERAGRSRDFFAGDIFRVTTLFANVYFAGSSEQWVLVDAGLPGFEKQLRRAAAAHFVPDSKPAAIILTHGHRDHAGSAAELASAWDVPIYAHPLEMPFLTGKSKYAPKDPTVGGIVAFASRVLPAKAVNLGDRVCPLPPDGSVPGAPEWRWVHTPGHTHGHIALFRERDRTLMAGDALTTVNHDSPYTAITRRPEFYRPPAPFTVDWDAAEASIHALAALKPNAVGAGHGWPIHGAGTADRLLEFATHFRRPSSGRYAIQPARADERGIISLPPPVPDHTGRLLAAWAVTGVAGVAALLIAQQVTKHRDRSKEKEV
jgi:glyoxylase-like metal-dependent hydrolase (beta-lactamase superfamily II)